MKISTGDGFHDLVIDFEDEDSDQLKDIIAVILPAALNLFAAKNRGYKKTKRHRPSLGARGEFVEIERKVTKLELGIWDGDSDAFNSESREEVVNDLLGHCLLMLDAFASER